MTNNATISRSARIALVVLFVALATAGFLRTWERAEVAKPIDFSESISESDRRWLESQIPRAEPDAFSSDLDQVMAALAPDMRELLVIFVPRNDRYDYARAWAATPETLTGDDEQIEYFLDILDDPFNPDPDASYMPDQQTANAEMERIAALQGAQRCVASGRFESHHDRVESLVVEHAEHPPFRDYAGLILLLLEEQGDLSEPAKKTLAQLRTDPVVGPRLDRFLREFKQRFFGSSEPNEEPLS